MLERRDWKEIHNVIPGMELETGIVNIYILWQ